MVLQARITIAQKSPVLDDNSLQSVLFETCPTCWQASSVSSSLSLVGPNEAAFTILKLSIIQLHRNIFYTYCSVVVSIWRAGCVHMGF